MIGSNGLSWIQVSISLLDWWGFLTRVYWFQRSCFWITLIISKYSTDSSSHQLNSKLPNSTTSPKSSPELSTSRITDITSSIKDDNEDYDNDTENISVTGSPDITSLNESDNQQELKSESGAFTSIIQKHKKSEFSTSFPGNSHLAATNPMINHALAAHLFFHQNPLLPPPNQWLYNHLYNNYSDFPWLRHSLSLNANSQLNPSRSGESSEGGDKVEASGSSPTINPSKTDLQRSLSPPVSSTKRSLSPEDDEIVGIRKKRSLSVDSVTNENIDDSNCNKSMDSNNNRNRMLVSAGKSDVWRPY